MHPKVQSTPARGFTLVELLVVIAVIAVLAAILFPVFAQARDSARRASCLSNMRQLGTAVEMYKSDNNGEYPTVRSAVEGELPQAEREEYFSNWTDGVFPYVKNGIRDDRKSLSGKRFSGVFHCPSDPGDQGPSYGINGWFLAHMSETQVVKPAETVFMAEKRGTIPHQHFTWWYRPWPGYPPPEGTSIAEAEAEINAIDAPVDEAGIWYPGFEEQMQKHEAAGLQTRRHAGGAHYLYADGHVKWGKLVQIWGNATSTNQFWPTRR